MAGCYAIIVAAGRGHRMGGDMPKQYRLLAGRAVLTRSVAAFARHPAIDGVRVVYNPDDQDLYDQALGDFGILPPVAGGASRQGSVLNGLESLADLAPDRVLIHDAARPFVDAATIDAIVAALDTHRGAIAAAPVVDTLKREAAGVVSETVPRDGLWRAQTPQGFRYGDILSAHRAATGEDLTDDAAVLERAGIPVALVASPDTNFKITTEDDMARAERLLSGGGDIRTGMGFDVHRFGPGDHVWLCGIQVPHDHGLVGHSDADAGLHALTDAVLGAIGEGDIGAHFPPSDPQWKGAPSDVFLKKAGELVAARNGAIRHLDLTLICEAPKIRPHVAAMRQRIADILGIDLDRVSVKATTTEGLGFTGRGEGLAAQAVATVVLGG